MAKYHISPKTGAPGVCRASVKPCPIGGADEHYGSKEEAREAYEKSQSEGGQTVTKLKKSSAPAADTGGMASVTSIGGTPITPEMTTKYQETLSKAYLNTTPPLNNSEKKVLQDVADGKKVSDEKLDGVIDRLRHVDKKTPYDREGDAENGATVVSYLKAVRSKSPAPNTLKDVKAFDPATQTMFSNKDARRHPMIAGKAIRRTRAHIEWINQLADEDRAAAREPGITPEERQAYLNSAAIRDDEVLRSEAKLQAQLKEIQHRYDTDETFRNNTKLQIARYLKDGFYRDSNDTYTGVPLEGVKKA